MLSGSKLKWYEIIHHSSLLDSSSFVSFLKLPVCGELISTKYDGGLDCKLSLLAD